MKDQAKMPANRETKNLERGGGVFHSTWQSASNHHHTRCKPIFANMNQFLPLGSHLLNKEWQSMISSEHVQQMHTQARTEQAIDCSNCTAELLVGFQLPLRLHTRLNV
jgi:hypothetical protein